MPILVILIDHEVVIAVGVVIVTGITIEGEEHLGSFCVKVDLTCDIDVL